MDDDLQTHPSQMHILLDKIQEGYDLVYGNYARRKNSFLKNLSSKFNRVTASILLGRPKNIVSSNYWVITKLVRDEVIKYTNYNPYIDAIFFRVTNNIADVTIEHHEREQGSSNYTFGKLVKLWMAYWNFSVVPLRISSMLGGIFSMGGFLGFVAILVRQLIAPSSQMGWASLMCAMLLFFGFVLLVLGIIGEYLGKIMLCINNTPQYIVRETVNVEGEE
jgi:undecaprenyl-phosphate 4-deoxy-4-formamido-L-arabinose transferase